MTETWKIINGFESYAVSDLGRVKRIEKSQGAKAEKLLSVMFNTSNGYGVVVLAKDKKRNTKAVHALVAEAFLGIKNIGDVVRHLDGNKTNNNVENLSYGTNQDNKLDSIAHGTWAKGEMVKTSTITENQAIEINRLLLSGVSPTEIANRLNVGRNAVYKIKYGKSWVWLLQANARIEAKIL